MHSRSPGQQALVMGHGDLKGTMGGLLVGLLCRQYVNTALLRRGQRRYLYCTLAEQRHNMNYSPKKFLHTCKIPSA